MEWKESEVVIKHETYLGVDVGVTNAKSVVRALTYTDNSRLLGVVMNEESEKLCFVIMPIGKGPEKEKWSKIYENYIKHTVESSGLGIKCERADSVPKPGSIVSKIVGRLTSADIVIADLSEQNPNVYYELGIRHSCSLRTILISKSTETLPFDVRNYNVLIYSDDPGEITIFQKKLIECIKHVLISPESDDNPVADYIGKKYIPLHLIINDDELLNRESLAKEVWIITNDIYESEDRFFNTVTDNLAEGVRYVSIVPDRDKIKLKITQLRRQYETVVDNKVENYFHILLPPKEFPFFFEFAIYDPWDRPSGKKSMEGRSGYHLINSSSEKRRYIRLEDDMVCNICAYIQSVWNKRYPENRIDYFPSSGPYL